MFHSCLDSFYFRPHWDSCTDFHIKCNLMKVIRWFTLYFVLLIDWNTPRFRGRENSQQGSINIWISTELAFFFFGLSKSGSEFSRIFPSIRIWSGFFTLAFHYKPYHKQKDFLRMVEGQRRIPCRNQADYHGREHSVLPLSRHSSRWKSTPAEICGRIFIKQMYLGKMDFCGGFRASFYYINNNPLRLSIWSFHIN